jgi:cyclopropane fatty-acyl-phospholipid synthase-like methyltransferase
VKRSSPAAQRNRAPIANELAKLSAPDARVLEVASGSGEHVVFFAERMPGCTFLPSDPSAEARASIQAYLTEAGLANVEPPRALDVTDSDWEIPCDVVLCCNMIHIAPWAATRGLLAGAARSLPPLGELVLYGPYRFHGQFLAPSNQAFDENLKSRDPAWGVRDIDDVDAIASEHGLDREKLVEMPANNHLVVYRRR